MKSTCVLCGYPLGSAKFIKPSGRRFVHVVCEQELLNEPIINIPTWIWYPYGIRAGEQQ